MNVLFVPRYLELGSSWLIFAELLIGMLLMVSIHCLATAVRGKEKNYLILGLFFVGALINSIGNIYIRFFVTTIEPYIGSWIMMGSFVLFIEGYLALPVNRRRLLIGRAVLVVSAVFLVVSAGHNLVYGRQDTRIIYLMDLVTAALLFGLMGFLLVHAVRGNRRGFYLFLFELTIVIGGIAALGVVKAFVVDMGLFPIEFFQSNLVFVIGMTLNGILFSNLLGFDLMDLKVKTALAEERNRDLKERDLAKSNLMLNMSHEFRTPITIIGGVLKQLKRGKWGDSISANRKNLEVIERNSHRLHKQVDGFLQLATMEKQNQALHPEAFDLKANLQILAGEFSSLAELKQITFTLRVPEHVQMIADTGLFRTAMVNLLGNALKFTPSGGKVSVDVSLAPGEIRIAVGDTGPGIPEEEQQRVFHRFHRLNGDREACLDGTGIGLSLVKMVMERHKGRVELQSNPGMGSTFILVFPVSVEQGLSAQGGERPAAFSAPAAPIAPASTVVESGSNGPEPDHMVEGHRAEIIREVQAGRDLLEQAETPVRDPSKPVVLVVEDDPELQEFLYTELVSSFSLFRARNGREAMEQMGRQTPDLVISDVMMPEMDGYQLFAAMQDDERLRLVPVLFLTARHSEEERLSAYEQGVVDYISKPFSLEVLISRVRNIIERNSSFREDYQQYVKHSLVSFLDKLPLTGGDGSGLDRELRFSEYCRASGLSEREMEVALLVRKGLSDKEIASSLGLSAKTVGNYNSSIFKKCGFTGRIDLVAWGRRPEAESSPM
ncbi:MAG: response regulator [Spirochaetales bacterium]|nr:response regulator [Spirochaetales bacterium]MCF7938283.1 response regulator [Spirochaetales bacterium]